MTCMAVDGITVTACCSIHKAERHNKKNEYMRYVLTCTTFSIVTHKYLMVFDKTSRGTWDTAAVRNAPVKLTAKPGFKIYRLISCIYFR